MPAIDAPEELAHVVWKLEQGFTTVSADHASGILKWARALAAENAELRDLIRTLQKEGE